MKKLLMIMVMVSWCSVAVALSESTKNNIINTIESNAMVSKAKFGHDEVGEICLISEFSGYVILATSTKNLGA